MDLYTSTNNGVKAPSSSDISALQQIEQNDATDLSPESEVRTNASTGQNERFPWVPPEFYVYRGKTGLLEVGVNSTALAELTKEAEHIVLQPEFDFKPKSQEAELISSIATVISAHLENDRAISDKYWVQEYLRFEMGRASYNAAFAAKQLRDAESLFARLAKQGTDAEDIAENETFKSLMANYDRAGREAAIQTKALYRALDKVEIDWTSGASRVLQWSARSYWTPRVRSTPTQTQKVERSNDATRELMRAVRQRVKGAA